MKRPLTPAIGSLLIGGLALVATADAYELRTERSLIFESNPTVTTQAYFESPVSGDLYLALQAYGRLYFFGPEGFSRKPVPLAVGDFDGELNLGSFSAEPLPPGSYPLHLVVARSGSHVMQSENWVGGSQALQTIRLTLSESPTQVADQDQDGWPDGDLDFDGAVDPGPTPPGANDPQITTPSAGRLLASQCAQCHGPDGVSYTGIDDLTGEAGEIAEEFPEFQFEESGIMHFQALGYTDQEVQSIANWFAGQSSADGSDGDSGDDDGDEGDREDDDD